MLALRKSNRGSLLIISLILVVIVLGMSASYLVVSEVQSRRTSELIEQVRARDAAEAGIDHMRVYLLGLVNPFSTDPGAAWDQVVATNGGTPAWAGSVATPEGSYTVRVLDNNDGDGNLLDDIDGTVILEATGYGTKLGANGASHVIRCMVTLEVNDPTDNFAIITGGDLEIYGNEIVEGTLGSVHTNEDLTLQGSASVSQDATASATTTVTGDNTQVGGDLLANQPVVPIETVDPTRYRPYANYIMTATGQVLDGATGAVLFDFAALGHSSLRREDTRRTAMLRTTFLAGFGMPDDHANDRNNNNAYGNAGGGTSGSRASSSGASTAAAATTSSGTSSSTTTSGASGGSTTAATTDSGTTSSGSTTTSTTETSSPSSGSAAVATAEPGMAIGSSGGGNAQSFNGLTWDSHNGWGTAASGWVDGVYYIEGSIDFNHGGTSETPWKVTLVATGDIRMQGNPYMQPYLNDVELMVAGGDVYARGTGTSAELEGLILAHEQIDLDGNITFAGRMVAESSVNVSGSTLDSNTDPLLSSFGGSVHVTYNGYMPRSLTTDYRLPVRSWQEDVPTNRDTQTLGNDAQVLGTTTQDTYGGSYTAPQ